MNTLKKLLDQPLAWVFEQGKISLLSNGQPVLTLTEEGTKKATFQLEGHEYVIRTVGFWSQKTVIEKQGQLVLSTQQSMWSSLGKVLFENGGSYGFKVHNSPLATLSFYTEDQREILHYKLNASTQPRTTIKIFDHEINEQEMMLLMILGCFSYKAIAMENGDADLLLLLTASA